MTNESIPPIFFLTPKEFADRLSVEPLQVYKWLKSGKIRAIKLNDSPKSPWRIPGAELYRMQAQAYDDEDV